MIPDGFWRKGLHFNNGSWHQFSIRIWRYCIIFRFVLYCWYGIKNQLSSNTKEVHRMGDLIRYPVMKTVKDAAAIYGLPPTYIWTLCRTVKIRYVVAGHRWLVNMNSLAKYFNEGDPVPAGQDEAVGGIRRVVGRWKSMAHRNAFCGTAEQGGGILYFCCISTKGHSQTAAHCFPLLFTGDGFGPNRDVGLCNLVQPNIFIHQTQLDRW